MAKDLKRAVFHSRDTLLADSLGAASLMVILFVALSLPGLV
ncbi:hypothetical protein OG2516_03068 [Oceanicola granulosus HTCC2516]|uniref:Uncharacterized protein n=1 Tax=Oceanicola granulosus (strain ATCC BAA-861 / DSM 15982 / KCTC 12143 / HTCC2516) TaxID=314256 RepID=Q2CEB2_OCEGH|nr:hypothetical protein [Oceanicola granulosus]EAR50948.1 hypothetical protein OG2516_03068 [Oceanicola granulosus HTCC2516]